MDFISTSSLIAICSVFGIGVIIALIVHNAWLLRVLIASYISLSLVLLMPKEFIFNAYADIIYFAVIVVILTFIEGSRFFDVASWNVKRFSLGSVGISVLTVSFIMTVICLFVPFQNLSILITKEVYNFFNIYAFYIAIAPLVLSLLFSSKLRM